MVEVRKFLFGVALAGPLAAGLGIKELKAFFETHPWVAILLAAIYYPLLFLWSLAQGVWGEIKSRWVKELSRWSDFQIECLVSGYRRKYLRHLAAECHDIDVKGLTTQGNFALALQRVFVELQVETETADRVPSEAAPQLPPKLAQGRHQLWDFLTAGVNLAVLGGPGGGKTTLLRHVALIVATRHRSHREAAIIRRLPVLLYLRNHAKAISENPEFSLAEAIEQGEIVRLQEEKPPAGWWKEQVHKDRCLIMMDGLDEVRPDARAKVSEWVAQAMRKHHGNVFVVSSRPGAFRENPVANVTVLAVRPFTPAQVRAFVESWYLANEMAARNANDPGWEDLAHRAAKKGAADLLARLRSSNTLTDLAVNPLLLTMIATVHKFRSELPGRRVELYREICDVFLGKRQSVKGVDDPAGLTPSQKQSVLEALAYSMMIAEVREVRLEDAARTILAPLQLVNPALEPAEFLRMVEHTSGLLVESEPGVYRFAHKTFQEYLTAVHIVKRGLAHVLAAKLDDAGWHETTRLYVAEGDATPVFQALLRHNDPPVNLLVLAAECLEEAKAAKPEYRERVNRMLQDGLEDDARWRVSATALLSRRLNSLTALSEAVEIDRTLITHAEYQLYIDVSPKAKPAHWPAEQLRYSKLSGLTPIVGVDSEQAMGFCQWLTEHSGGAFRYRLPQPLEVQRADSPPDVSGVWSGSTNDSRIVGTSIVDTEKIQACVLANTRALDLDRFLALARALALDDDLASALARDLASALDRELASALDRDLDRDLASALARDLASDRALSLGRALARALARDRDRALTLFFLIISSRFALMRVTPTQSLTIQFTEAVAEKLGVATDLCLPAAELVSRMIGQTSDLDTPAIRNRLDRLGTIPPTAARWREFLPRRFRQVIPGDEVSMRWRDLAETSAALFVQLTILEGRRRGELPAIGGILIVREHAEPRDAGQKEAASASA